MIHARGMRPLGAALLFTTAFVLAAVYLAPASLVVVPIERATEGRLTVVAASGRIWSGHGTLTARSDAAKVPLAWALTAVHPLRGSAEAVLTVGASEPVNVTISLARLHIGRLDVALPASIIAVASGATASFRVGGTTRARSAGIALERNGGSGRIALEWRDASTGFMAVAPLGSYGADLDWSGQQGSVTVHTLDGPLAIDGSGRWTSGGAALSVTARPGGERAETLKSWLRTMTPELPDGSFRFAWPQPGTPQRGARS